MNEIQKMPQCPDDERQVLGSILFTAGECFDEAAAIISAEDFYLDDNRKAFFAFAEMSGRGEKINAQSWHECMKRNGWEQEYFRLDVTHLLPKIKHIDDYAERVREYSRKRMLITAFDAAQNEAFDNVSTDEVIGNIESVMTRIIQRGRKVQTRTMMDITVQAYENICLLREQDGAFVGLATGLKELDISTTGFRAGEYYVIGARPGQGKTSLACQSIRENCKAGRKVAFFSIEMTEEQIALRLLAMETGIDFFILRDPKMLSLGEMERVQIACGEISQWPLIIDDSSKINIHELRARAKLRIKQGCEGIYVDYLQRVEGDGKSPFEKVTSVSEGLCELAKSSGVPVIALSQLRRNENGANAQPTLDDLRQSGQIEQDAHAVMLLYRPRGDEGFTGEDEIIIAKQRSGPSGRHLKVYFDGPAVMFKARA